jgi:hypothetical protein
LGSGDPGFDDGFGDRFGEQELQIPFFPGRPDLPELTERVWRLEAQKIEKLAAYWGALRASSWTINRMSPRCYVVRDWDAQEGALMVSSRLSMIV